jgi:RNA polymerase sigma-70 factor (ECF subfamily)
MDEGALIQVYRECVHPLYEFVSYRCGGDRGLAEDVTQETWLRAVQTWQKDGLPENPLAWLRTVARNLIVDYYRRHRPLSLESMPSGWEGESEEDSSGFDSPDAAALITWGLSRLRKAQADLLEAFHLEGQRVADIAARTGLSERAVEGRLHRARKKLRRHLESAVGRKGGMS